MTRKKVAALAAAGVVVAGLTALGPATVVASSHREAPLVAADPAIDNTDVYAFVSPDRAGLRHVRGELDPVRGAQRRPELLPVRDRRRVQHLRRQQRRRQAGRHLPLDVPERRQARRQHVPLQQRPGHLDRRPEPAVPPDVHAAVVVQRRSRSSTRSTNAPVAPSRVGKASMPDYGKLRKQAVTSLPGGWKIFAGQADDPFFLDLRVFDLLYGGNLTEVGHDTLAGYNVNTIALQVPFSDVALNGDAPRNPVIGVWTTADRPQRTRERQDRGRAWRATAFRSRGSATRWSTRSSSRPNLRTRSTPCRPTRTPRSRRSWRGSRIPRCRSSSQSIYKRARAGRAAQRPGRDLPDRHHHQGRRPDQGRPELAARTTPTSTRASSARRRCCG